LPGFDCPGSNERAHEAGYFVKLSLNFIFFTPQHHYYDLFHQNYCFTDVEEKEIKIQGFPASWTRSSEPEQLYQIYVNKS
jgi:hypothetical protein